MLRSRSRSRSRSRPPFTLALAILLYRSRSRSGDRGVTGVRGVEELEQCAEIRHSHNKIIIILLALFYKTQPAMHARPARGPARRPVRAPAHPCRLHRRPMCSQCSSSMSLPPPCNSSLSLSRLALSRSPGMFRDSRDSRDRSSSPGGLRGT